MDDDPMTREDAKALEALIAEDDKDNHMRWRARINLLTWLGDHADAILAMMNSHLAAEEGAKRERS